MNRTPDVELVLRDYFSNDSSSAPDHVLDVIEERILRQPQRRSWRVLRRDTHVNSYLKPLLAIAAIVVVAVAGFAVLRPSGAGVGGPAATETPTLSPGPSTLGGATSATGAFGGTVLFTGDGAPSTTEIDAVASGGTVTGTAVSTFRQGIHTVRLGCVTQDGDTWALGGTTDKSTIPGEPIGTWSAVIVREGSPQQIAIWFSGDAPAGSDCAGFLASHAFADLGPEAFEKVESGALVPPPDLAP